MAEKEFISLDVDDEKSVVNCDEFYNVESIDWDELILVDHLSLKDNVSKWISNEVICHRTVVLWLFSIGKVEHLPEYQYEEWIDQNVEFEVILIDSISLISWRCLAEERNEDKRERRE